MSAYLDHNASSPMHAPVLDASRFPVYSPGGPRAVGALVAGREPREISIGRGDRENIRRGGTEYLAGSVGPGIKVRLARLEIERRQLHLGQLRDRFELRRAAAA